MATQKFIIPAQVDIDLSNATNQISEIKRALTANLKVDSSISTKLNALFVQLAKESEKVGIAFNKGFSTQAEINKTEQGLQSMQTLMGKITDTAQKIDFSDIDLSPAAIRRLEDAGKAIQDVKAQLDTVQKVEIKNLFKNVDFKTVAQDLKITEQAAENLSKVDEKLGREQQKRTTIVTSIEAQKTALEKFNTTQEESARLASELETRMEAIRQKVTAATDDKAAKFRPGGRADFEKLGKEFGLVFKDFSAGEVEQAFQQITALTNNYSAVLSDLNPKLDASRQAELQVANARQAASASAQTIEQSMKSLEQQMVEVTAENDRLTQELTENNINMRGAAVATDSFGSSLDRMQNTIPAVSAELERLNEQQQSLDRIQNTIKHWLGFGAAVMYTRKAIREAFESIQELDKAMTDIAVVTDMTTAELWGQIEVYMAVAQQYGVTTKGVYEIAQLYFQQGLSTIEVNELTTETLKMARQKSHIK